MTPKTTTSDNITENGVPAGTWNKYNSRNPVQNWLIRRFETRLQDMVRPCLPHVATALDFGCGQGRTTKLLQDLGVPEMYGCDMSEAVLAEARVAAPEATFFLCRDNALRDMTERYDLVCLIEVLEHLEDPESTLEAVCDLARAYVLLTVPDEPLFRSMNFLAGKYIREFGNAPGHIQHWNKRSFLAMVEQSLDIITATASTPWLMVLGRPRAATDNHPKNP